VRVGRANDQYCGAKIRRPSAHHQAQARLSAIKTGEIDATMDAAR
jgi:hypothetical protein